AQVLQEFIAESRQDNRPCEWLDKDQVTKRCPAVQAAGLRGGLWSPSEICVDPREVIAGLPSWLQQAFGVHFEFGTPVTGFRDGKVLTPSREWTADHLVVCSGDDVASLYPETFANCGLVRCKLQMMRSQAYGSRFKLGPMLAAGLTLRHYAAFAHCPT